MWIERDDSTQRPYVHCFIFAAVAEPAYDAFGPLYGSTRDRFAPICEPPGGLFELSSWKQLDAGFAGLIDALSKDAGTIRYASYAEWRVVALRAAVSPVLFSAAGPAQALRQRSGSGDCCLERRRQRLAGSRAQHRARYRTRCAPTRLPGCCAKNACRQSRPIRSPPPLLQLG
ncbi:hypothetical protein [Xanthomonas oryzae]